MSVGAIEKDLVLDLFVRTADENYVTARWCAVNQLYIDFLWLSVHAIEKYLKAVLLVNGCAAKNYRHDISALYGSVKIFSADLLPEVIVKPKGIDAPWHDCTPEEFLSYIYRYGNADNRYLTYGYVTRSQDLHMLDAMVFSIRRLICDLDARVFPQHDRDAPIFTSRELLMRQPNYYTRLNMPLDHLISKRCELDKRKAALNLNMAFAPDDYTHEPIRSGFSARNPVIVRRIIEPLNSDNVKQVLSAMKTARWFLDNVQVPSGKRGDPSVKVDIEDAMAAARNKHALD